MSKGIRIQTIVRPFLCEWLTEQASYNQVSVSTMIASLIEESYKKDHVNKVTTPTRNPLPLPTTSSQETTKAQLTNPLLLSYLKALADIGEDARSTDIMAVMDGISEKNFYRLQRELMVNGLIVKGDGKFGKWKLTSTGLSLITANQSAPAQPVTIIK